MKENDSDSNDYESEIYNKNNNYNNNLENIINSKEEGKQYLEGELHKETPENQIDSNLTENNNIQTESINISQKTNFLKYKLTKMNVNKNISYGINKSMDKQMKSLETDIYNNKILMTETPTNLSKILSKSFKKINNFEKKSKLKIIKELQDEKEILNIKLQKLISNQKFLENGVGAGGDSTSTNNFSLVDQNVLENKKKNLNEKKTELMDKIDQINDKLNQIITNMDEEPRKERIKNYIENFEKDREIIETRAKKYYKEAMERNKRMENDINKKAEKRKKQIDDKFKEQELKKVEILRKLKEQEKATVQKRTKINDEKANKFKPFLKKIFPKENLKEYLFIKKYEEFQNETKNLVNKENLKRKEKMKMDFNEINEFEKNYVNNMENYGANNGERKKMLIKEWKERKELLPTYVCHKQEMVQEELKKEIENEENKKEMNKALNQKRYLFGYDIKNNKQPEINKKLEKQRINLIKSLVNPKLALREQLLIQRQKKAEELNLENNNNSIKKNKSKSSKKIKIKIEESVTNLNNNSISLNEHKKAFSPKVYPLHPKPLTKINYLNEVKMMNGNSISNDIGDNKRIIKINNLKWKKEINCEKGTVIENVNFVKEKAKAIDDEIKKNEKILKVYGGVENNPEIREKVSNLLLDSIEAKFSILNKLNEE